jgi:hypothetical protein
LYLGADGTYKDGDDVPWTVTGKWKYSRNRENEVVGGLTFPDIPGHSYVWLMYERIEETITHNAASFVVIKEYPMWGYVEDVYFESDHGELGFN